MRVSRGEEVGSGAKTGHSAALGSEVGKGVGSTNRERLEELSARVVQLGVGLGLFGGGGVSSELGSKPRGRRGPRLGAGGRGSQ